MLATSVERFWSTREGAYTLDDGFLRDPDAGWFGARSANPGVLRIGELSDRRCLVLLGEPGAGKSTAVHDRAQLVSPEVPVIAFDLAVYGSEDRLVSEVFGNPAIKDWVAGTGELCLLLDSLDEVRARVPQVGAALADRLRQLPCERLFLRIACRTVDWPAGLEEALAEVFECVEVVEILPLRRTDAAEIVAQWCDPYGFLSEVTQSAAGPLAARPLTLRFLARMFGEHGRLPGRGAELYAIGLRSLCEEQNVGRRDSGLVGELSLDARVAVARRLAAAAVFGGASSLWLGAAADAGVEDLGVERLIGSAEPTPDGSVPVTVAAVREATRTGLFTSRGGQRIGWAHATFADFLAADWVVANNLSATQARPLFLSPDGRCWPQTRLVAAWAVAIAPTRFGFLAEADPEAFLGEVGLPDDAMRAAVIDGLFMRADTLVNAPWDRRYRMLRHRDIADQLRPYLRDSDADRRQLALDLVKACAAVELREDLVSIALDKTLEERDRVAAAWSLMELPDQLLPNELRPLALDDEALRGDDPSDEIKGAALLASWPHAMSGAEVFSILTSGQRGNFLGSYALFIERFRSGITADDVDAGMQWLDDNPDAPVHDHTLGALANRVLELAATRPLTPALIGSFAHFVLARARHHEGLLFQDFRNERSDPFADPALRRAVALEVLNTDPNDDLLYGLCERTPHSLSVIRQDDLRWLADLYTGASQELRPAICSLFTWTFDSQLADHLDLVLDMDRNHALNIDLVHAWTDPVALDSPEAAELRRWWDTACGHRPTKEHTGDNVNKEIEELLDRFENGDGMGFWYAMRLLTVAPGSKYFDREFDPDVVGRPRWPTLPEAVRKRIVNCAERYLRSQRCDPERWLPKPDIRFHPAEAGYKAMVLLLREEPERLQMLPPMAWIEWAPVPATLYAATINGATWGDKLKLLQISGPAARTAMRFSLLTRLKAVVETGKRPWLSNEAGYLWDTQVAAGYLALARKASAEPREELVTTLAEHDFDLLRPLLLDWLNDPTVCDRQQLAARQLVDSDLERSWPAVKVALDKDTVLAENVLGNTHTVRGDRRFAEVSPSVLADIYLWLFKTFPPETDPRFDDTEMAHAVSPREQVGHWRDNLLTYLRDLGTPEAVNAVRAVRKALPARPSLARTLAIAEATLRRNEWCPTPLTQLLQLVENGRNVLVNGLDGLTTAVEVALERIQARLTGATPESHYLWDSHTGRPKSEDEISDYIANELDQELTARGVIVNREVQLRRNRPSGIGERSDLLIDAAPVGKTVSGRLSLPVEVKGAWNDEVLTAMREQLHDRYMHDAAATHGVYIVAWPDLKSWSDTSDQRRRMFASLDRPSIEAELASQVTDLAEHGAHVTVVHVDVAYRRPA